MKNLLLALGLATITVPAAYAQLQDHKHSNEYSVFSDYRHTAENKNGAISSKEKVTKNFPGWVGKYDRISGSAINIYGPGKQLNGATLAEKAANCIAQKMQDFGINSGEWRMTRNSSISFAGFVDYEQVINGHSVFLSKLGFRFSKDGKLTSIKLNNYGSRVSTAGISINNADAANAPALLDGLSEVSITSRKVENDWVWFPVPSQAQYILYPAYVVTMEGKDMGNNKPVNFTCYLDATSGKLLYRTDAIADIVDVTMLGNVLKNTNSGPVTQEPLANLQVTIPSASANYTTDAAGKAVTNEAGPVSASISVTGPWAVIKDVPAGNIVPSASVALTDGSNQVVLPQGNMNTKHINAFYHTNRVHDFQKQFFQIDPNTATALDRQFTVSVDVSGSCNAFYNNATLNFYIAGNGCPSFAEISDIVYHEYGHGINDFIYRKVKGINNRGMTNGALNEGHADVWAFSINNDPIVGENSMGAGSNIRRYDQNIKIFPRDIVDEVHADGEIIAGCWYDLALNLNDFGLMTQIFTKSYYSASDGASGTEGDIYFDVLIAALEADDTDADITNGTPHMIEIVRAFAKHGIYLMNDATLTHKELAHQAIGQPIDVTATLNVTYPTLVKDLKLCYRDRKAGKWDTLAMAKNNNVYSAQIPAVTAPSIIEYYFALYDISEMATVRWPYAFDQDASLAQKVTIPYQFGVGITPRFQTGFEQADPAWTIGDSTDDATSGQWILAKPVGTVVSSASGTIQVQPSADNSGSGQCLVTGNGTSNPTTADVDNGNTTVITPVFDLTNYTYPVIEYYRWYTNNTGDNPNNDYWQVQLRNTGSSIWRNVDYTNASDASWRRKLIAIKDIYSTPSTIVMRFVAADRITAGTGSGQSTVEAAVDDFAIYDIGNVSVGTSPESLKAQIYPNPADQQINIIVPQGTTGKLGLYDLTGRAISMVDVDAANSNYRIGTSGIPTGTYMVVLQANALVQVQKVVIAH